VESLNNSIVDSEILVGIRTGYISDNVRFELICSVIRVISLHQCKTELRVRFSTGNVLVGPQQSRVHTHLTLFPQTRVMAYAHTKVFAGRLLSHFAYPFKVKNYMFTLFKNSDPI
jgi:hypothetical protein